MSFFDLTCVCGIILYAGTILISAPQSLNHLPNVVGLTRIYSPPQQRVHFRILDPRQAPILKEIQFRFSSSSSRKCHELSSLPSKATLYDWQITLKNCGYQTKLSKGTGPEAQISLIWPLPSTIPSEFSQEKKQLKNQLKPHLENEDKEQEKDPYPGPFLVIGHYQTHRIWVHPQYGVILSDLPTQWDHAPSLILEQVNTQWW